MTEFAWVLIAAILAIPLTLWLKRPLPERTLKERWVCERLDDIEAWSEPVPDESDWEPWMGEGPYSVSEIDEIIADWCRGEVDETPILDRVPGPLPTKAEQAVVAEFLEEMGFTGEVDDG